MRTKTGGIRLVVATLGLMLGAVPAAVARVTGTTAETLAVVYDFPSRLFGSVIQARDGHLYVTAGGSVWRMTTAGDVTNVYLLDYATIGGYPGNLVEGNDGNFYGATGNGGGPADCGSVFRLTPGGVATPLHTFTQAEGNGAKTVIQGRDGHLYGTTLAGGALDGGTIFRLTLDGAFLILHHFERLGPILTRPSEPQRLLQASDGNFYGVTLAGGVGHGSLFRMTPSGSLSVLHAFTAGAGGSSPTGPVVQGLDGNLYGTTVSGIDAGGTAYRLQQDGTFTVLHSFDPATEGPEAGPLTLGTDGRFYGFTRTAAFRMTPTGAVTVLHTFNVAVDGWYPTTAPLHATDGNFYAVNHAGGRFSSGTLFRLRNPAPCDNAVRVLFSNGTPSGLRFTLKSAGASFWTTWLVSTTGVSTLWALPVPAVSPAVSFDVPWPAASAPDNRGVYTLLVGPGLVTCGDWESLR